MTSNDQDANACSGDYARVIQVIETTLLRRGLGSEIDPIRVVTQYWSMEGKLLFEIDPCS